ncbi:MAG: MATE family efflux transporter, partial [Erysipelotrichaceae bacterium]|nr:MATE family efflux transporter [Erysipelotrichaceae bacterium]
MSAEKYVGDKQFYSDVCRLAIPSMLQQLLSSAMGMVDTMMVSAIGMVSPVGVASQLGNICSCISFGVMEGTGIYASQFYGADDRKNLQRTFGLSIILSLIVGFVFFG